MVPEAGLAAMEHSRDISCFIAISEDIPCPAFQEGHNVYMIAPGRHTTNELLGVLQDFSHDKSA